MKTFGKKYAINCNDNITIERRLKQAVLSSEERVNQAGWVPSERRPVREVPQVADSRKTDTILSKGVSFLLTVGMLGFGAYIAVSTGVPYFEQLLKALGGH
jgi:hypothetical protein